jgi:hypothetical protein
MNIEKHSPLDASPLVPEQTPAGVATTLGPACSAVADLVAGGLNALPAASRHALLTRMADGTPLRLEFAVHADGHVVATATMDAVILFQVATTHSQETRH